MIGEGKRCWTRVEEWKPHPRKESLSSSSEDAMELRRVVEAQGAQLSEALRSQAPADPSVPYERANEGL